jgi:hypothetical protein
MALSQQRLDTLQNPQAEDAADTTAIQAEDSLWTCRKKMIISGLNQVRHLGKITLQAKLARFRYIAWRAP